MWFYLFTLIADVFEVAFDEGYNAEYRVLSDDEKSFCTSMMSSAANAAELFRDNLPDIPEIEDVFWKGHLTLVK